MIERIKEIAEQALENSLFETIEPTITVGEGENKVTIPLVFAEKLTKLVAQECVSICLDRHHTWRWDNEPDSSSGPRECAQLIKEHFGVE